MHEYLSPIFVCSLSTRVITLYSFFLASSSAPQTSLGGVSDDRSLGVHAMRGGWEIMRDA